MEKDNNIKSGFGFHIVNYTTLYKNPLPFFLGTKSMQLVKQST